MSNYTTMHNKTHYILYIICGAPSDLCVAFKWDVFSFFTMKKLDKSKKYDQMKISLICLSGLASATEKKVPPSHPLQRLKRLVEFSSEILNSGAFNNKSSKWINNWEQKFSNNGE